MPRRLFAAALQHRLLRPESQLEKTIRPTDEVIVM